MLKEAIDLQQNAVSQLLDITSVKNEITFKAPTGSGKTYMMADFMNRILTDNKDIVFLVSTLSKGNLAKQNFDKFTEYSKTGKFNHLKPYLINTDVSDEQALFIPVDYNVYILPRDLYKKGGKLMQGAMSNFLQIITLNEFLHGKNKKIYLIKDECHDATNNLDTLSNDFFTKIYNFSATPNLRRGQVPDVEISEVDAVNAKLIKKIVVNSDPDCPVEDAIIKFEEIKKDYRNKLGVNPCLIIQISNALKADQEINDKIMPILKKAEHQDLKWMIIVNDEKDCDTNDVFKAKKMPVKKWKDYVKSDTAPIDIIIFKMVISEGWDIPRACMLYQVRNTVSEQLDEQVIGRVRRNPRLLDFESLDLEAQELATTAWVWGTEPKNGKITRNVKLVGNKTDVQNVFKIKVTGIKEFTENKKIDINKYLNNVSKNDQYNDIFSLFKKLNNVDSDIKKICYDYADTYQKWWSFNDNIDDIIKEYNTFSCDYEQSMYVCSDESGNDKLISFPSDSSYVDNGNYENITDWIWKRKDGMSKFSFDSEAEWEWVNKLEELMTMSLVSNKEKKAVKSITIGDVNPKRGMITLDGTIEPDILNPETKYLWGKNFISNSEIKYDYYLNGIHSSYPDFLMMDSYGRIHIFEVKSVNINPSLNIDTEKYEKKINELKRCYKQASKLTGHYFYLPVLKNNIWYITQLINGEEKNLTYEQFVNFVLTN